MYDFKTIFGHQGIQKMQKEEKTDGHLAVSSVQPCACEVSNR